MFKPHWNKAEVYLKDPADETQDSGLLRKSGRTKVYLCLPYEGDSKAYAAKAYDIFREANDGSRYVFAPYLVVGTISALGSPFTWEIGRSLASEMIRECDEFWVTRDLLSKNVMEEFSEAVVLKKKICWLTRNEEETADE
jgi:hypothetical protein